MSTIPTTIKSVLDPVRHARLIQDLDHIAKVAGVPIAYIKQSMVPFCDGTEIDYITNFRMYREIKPGLLLVGKQNEEQRCFAMAGALLRNFIDARIVHMSQLLEMLESGDGVTPSVLIVPNFYDTEYGKALPSWKAGLMYDLLLCRAAESKPTILSVDSFHSMKVSYGLGISRHLEGFIVSDPTAKSMESNKVKEYHQ